MLAYLRGQPDQHDRLRPLWFSHACCRSVWDTLEPQEQSVAAFLERLLAQQDDSSPQLVMDWLVNQLGYVIPPPISQILRMWNLNWWIIPLPILAMTLRSEFTASDQAFLLREIVGNPFRKVTFEAEWRTAAVASLVESIREGRHSLYPILADALLDAGSRDETILDHCRQSGQHFKHCWVIEGLHKPHANPVGNG